MGITGGESHPHSSLASRKMRRKSPKTEQDRDFKHSLLLATQSVVRRAESSKASPESLIGMQNFRLFLDLLNQIVHFNKYAGAMHAR